MKTLQKFLKQIMIKQFIVSVLVLFFVVVPTSSVQVYAQSEPTGPSIAGDSVCGGGGTVKDKDGNERVANPCTIQDLGKVVKGLLALVVSIGLPLLIVFVSYRFIMAWFALQQGNANAYKEALEKAGNAVFGFVIIILLIGGFLFVALRFLGVDERVLKIFEILSDASRGAFIPHAYAATGNYLPNFLSVNNLYDFMLTVLRFIMRFFVYPALIVIWVITGFSFIFAQGNPAKIVTAKKWLIGAFITTFIIFMIQTFLIAIRGTVQNVLPGGSSGASLPPDVVTKQVSAEKSLSECIKNGRSASSCASAYASSGGLGNPTQAVAKQAYNSCLSVGKSKTLCNTIFKDNGGTGSPSASPLDEKAGCGPASHYDPEIRGCTADQSTGGCDTGYHRDREARQCVKDTSDTSADGGGYGASSNGDPYTGQGDLTPISPSEVKSEPNPSEEPTPLPGDVDPESASDVDR